MSSILYYITGHGYGHAVRSNLVVHRLIEARSDLTIHFRTTVPDRLFSAPPSRLTFSRRSLDIGIVQKDSLEMNIDETLSACHALHKRIPQIVEEEIAFIKQHHVDLIVGDIPPLCFEVAARVNIPSIAISNFSWSSIYRAYLGRYPEFRPLINEMENFYKQATLALSLPYPCGMEIFPRQEPIPWIARKSSLTKKQARAKFALPESATIVLLSFGGMGFERLPWNQLKQLSEFFFVATGEATKKDDNILVLPEVQRDYENLVRAVDVIVTKPGYGIVADALAHQVPVLYTDRGDFPEYEFLVQALRDLAPAEYIPQSELLSGDMGPYLRGLLAKEAEWPLVSMNGAPVAAEKILSLL